MSSRTASPAATTRPAPKGEPRVLLLADPACPYNRVVRGLELKRHDGARLRLVLEPPPVVIDVQGETIADEVA